MTTEEKIDRIIMLLEDENIGICPRVKLLEQTVNGNGGPGLSEQIRTNSRNWGILVTVVLTIIPLAFWVLK